MKKFFTVLIVCVLIVLLFCYVWSNPQIIKSIATPIAEAVESITLEKEIPYTTEFTINDINIKGKDYYYQQLSGNEKAVYQSLANAVKSLETEFLIQEYEFVDADTTMKEIEEGLHCFLLDHPEIFYLRDTYGVSTNQSIFGDKVYLKVSYTIETKEELDKQVQEIKDGMQEVINQANITIGTDFEKEQRLHDVLGKNVAYYEYENINEIPHNAHTIYGAFVEKSAVCDGLSKAMQLLLDQIDMNAILVTGRLNNESHAWNMVQIEGSWYHLDLTSNKSIKDYDDIVIHSYFNITTEKIKQTHTINREEKVPIANNLEKNYFVVYDKIITASDNFNQKLRNILLTNQDSEKIEYQVENVSNVADKTINVLRNGAFWQYLDSTRTRFIYYTVLDNYIIIK